MEILFYIGIILLAIGTWQSFMCGIHSEMISTVSLIIGTILVFVGNWHVGFFFVFVFFSWVLLTQIFNFSTYHRYFPIAVIFLLIHAVIVAILLQKFGFSNFVWWYLILTAGRQIIHHKKQHQQKNLLDSLLEAESEDRSKMEKSTSNTMKYHLLSSILFILAVALAFFYFAGSNNIKHLSNSIDLATKVARISNASQPYERVPEKDIKKSWSIRQMQHTKLIWKG